MSAVLLLRLAGPMQSWGTRSRFQERDTEREPSKSGVIGLLCAAIGRDRSLPVADLSALKMGVRADREGNLKKDFQTAQNVAVAGGGSLEDMISNRHYLADAEFLVSFEGDAGLLKYLHSALMRPVWPLFLGRKSYVPSLPIYLPDGYRENVSLRESLMAYPLQVRQTHKTIRLLLESSTPTHESRMDSPVSFEFGHREFRERFVVTEFVPVETFSVKEDEDVPVSAHT
ncbi:MAG: type I-E CRISPR-associated protein Cas5/CasD [Deltaproteobacteria bacterium]|jgi:CRISPR system Cascade subunit CasD